MTVDQSDVISVGDNTLKLGQHARLRAAVARPRSDPSGRNTA
jgi:hypothetical protein